MPITPVHGSGQPYDASITGRLGVWRALGRRLDPQDPRVAREAASLLISQLFFVPLLAEMRRIPFGREFGHGGRMEDALGEQLDLRIADTVARSDRSLTAQLTEKLLRREPGNQATRQPGTQAMSRSMWTERAHPSPERKRGDKTQASATTERAAQASAPADAAGQPGNQATRQPGNQATGQPGNEATRQ